MIIPENIQKIINDIEFKGYEVYIVGGAVRDFLLGKIPSDYDLTTNATPEELKEIFNEHKYIKVYDVGIKHGTLTLCYNNFCVEITTYRTEKGYLDLRHPDNVSFVKSIDDDLKRRDFTINAICYRNGIYDPLNGQKDLKNKLIRAIGNPNERFNEDALRIIRGIRFAAVLNFDIEKNTKNSIFTNKELLKLISIERIRDEFDKIIMSNNVCNILNIYYDVLFEFFREFGNIYNVNMNFLIIDKLEKNLVLRLVGFFYTIIKNTFSFKVGLDYQNIIKKILLNFKYSLDTAYSVSSVIFNLNLELTNNKISIKTHLSSLGYGILEDLIRFKIAILETNQKDTTELTKISLTLKNIINNNEVYSLKQLNINGTNLVELGINEGPQIGNILNDILLLIINEKLINKKECIIDFVKENYLP